MKLTVVSDLHDSLEHLAVLRRSCEDSDALIVCGDFTTFGDQERVQTMADAVAVAGKPCYFVIGNCDTMAVDGELEGWRNLHGRVCPLDGWLLAGIGGSLPCPGHTPSEFSEDVFEHLLESVLASCGNHTERLILVCHQPAFDTAADLLPGGRHVGSRTLRAFIDRVQPAYCLSGHIHEAASRSKVGRTLVLNPGSFKQGCVATLEL